MSLKIVILDLFMDLFMDFLGIELDLFLALEDLFKASLTLESLANFPSAETLLLFMELLDLLMDFLEMDLLLAVAFLFLLDCAAIAFFLVRAEGDTFWELDLTGSGSPFTMIDGMRALDLNPETFIFFPVDVAFLDFLFLLEVAIDSFLKGARCILLLLVLDLTILEFPSTFFGMC